MGGFFRALFGGNKGETTAKTEPLPVPNDPVLLKALADEAMQAGDLKRAQQLCRALLLQKIDDPTKRQVYEALGQILEKEGDAARAKMMFDRARSPE